MSKGRRNFVKNVSDYKLEHSKILKEELVKQNKLQCERYDTLNILDALNKDTLDYVDVVMDEKLCYLHNSSIENSDFKKRLNELRSFEAEHLELFGFTNDNQILVHEQIKVGNLGSIEISCDEIASHLERCKDIPKLVLVHNHPHYINAGLSNSDRLLPIHLKIMGHFTKRYNLYDFMVVTEFDTWSFLTEMKNLLNDDSKYKNVEDEYKKIFKKEMFNMFKKP